MRKNNFISVKKVVELGGGGRAGYRLLREVPACNSEVLEPLYEYFMAISDEIEAATIAMVEATFVVQ